MRSSAGSPPTVPDPTAGAPGRSMPGELRLHGFVSKPEVQKLNRNSIFVFVNGRLITADFDKIWAIDAKGEAAMAEPFTYNRDNVDKFAKIF